MHRRPPGSTRTDTLFPYTTLVRSGVFLGEGFQDRAFRLAGSGQRHAIHRAGPAQHAGDDAVVAFIERRRAGLAAHRAVHRLDRSEEHTSELQSLMRISYAVFCLKKKNNKQHNATTKRTNNTE